MADRVEELALHRSTSASTCYRLTERFGSLDDGTWRALPVRIEDLIEYQGVRYAERYARAVRSVAEREATLALSGNRNAVVRNLHKLMTYKDEYEVARLLTEKTFRNRTKSLVDGDCKMIFHLPPSPSPFWRSAKITIGEWFEIPLKLLYRMRFLRGTALDIFGYAKVRRKERELLR